MDNDQLKFLDKINTCGKHLELADQLINIGAIYEDLKDYQDMIKRIYTCIDMVERRILLTFEPLLFPAIIQHIKQADDHRLELIYINTETQIIYYAEKKELEHPEYWQIHIAEYDHIMHSATIIHRQFQGQINPPPEPDDSNMILQEISTVNIKNYKAWLQQNI